MPSHQRYCTWRCHPALHFWRASSLSPTSGSVTISPGNPRLRASSWAHHLLWTIFVQAFSHCHSCRVRAFPGGLWAWVCFMPGGRLVVISGGSDEVSLASFGKGEYGSAGTLSADTVVVLGPLWAFCFALISSIEDSKSESPDWEEEVMTTWNCS